MLFRADRAFTACWFQRKFPSPLSNPPVIRAQKVIPQRFWSKNTTNARTNPSYISAKQTGAAACGSGCSSTLNTAGTPPPTTKVAAPSGRWKTSRFCYWSTKSVKIVSSGNTSCWPLLREKTAFIPWQIGADRQNKGSSLRPRAAADRSKCRSLCAECGGPHRASRVQPRYSFQPP